MFNNILTQSPFKAQYTNAKHCNYFLRVANRKGNTQTLIAVFNSRPSFQDWQDWLSDWAQYDYYFASTPVLLTV